MPSLPIPLISALFLGFLLVRVWFVERRAGLLVTLLALCAAQGVVISLAQHYRVPGFAVVQPITASLIPPTAWLAFRGTAVRALRASDWLHAAGPVLVLLCLAARAEALDPLIPALFLGYGVAILWACRPGGDTTPRLRLENGDLPRLLWRTIGASLIASALSDVLILVANLAGAAFLQPWIIGVFSGVTLLLVGALGLSRALDAAPAEPEIPAEPEATEEDRAIVARLDALMRRTALHRDPDLTLAQLARRLAIPSKRLSGAINRATGANVSRYVNDARIRAAQDLLLAGRSITEAMLESGFNTKSNFNREFLRVAGKNPTDWLAERR